MSLSTQEQNATKELGSGLSRRKSSDRPAAVLTQLHGSEWRVIRYAWRRLSDVEQRYSQTEKEALALVWACERFNMYVFGREFERETDHKPLEYIYSQKSKPSARVER